MVKYTQLRNNNNMRTEIFKKSIDLIINDVLDEKLEIYYHGDIEQLRLALQEYGVLDKIYINFTPILVASCETKVKYLIKRAQLTCACCGEEFEHEELERASFTMDNGFLCKETCMKDFNNFINLNHSLFFKDFIKKAQHC